MGSLGVWVLAMAALLGASASLSAEGHRSGRRSDADAAGVLHTSSLEPRSAVSVGEKKHTDNAHLMMLYCVCEGEIKNRTETLKK